MNHDVLIADEASMIDVPLAWRLFDAIDLSRTSVVHKSHSFQHHRNLFYTGVTRASQTAIIVGDRWGISNCAKRVHVDARKTFLSLLLLGGAA